jgi:ribosomal protein S18 acetylase RimI-like enzyme
MGGVVEVVLRRATQTDESAIAVVWHEAWTAGHAEHLPGALLAHRTVDEFVARAPRIVADTTVATADGELVGFVTVHGDELVLLFVGSNGRGTGVARTLLREGERRIAEAGHAVAWLEVMERNARARRFYEREGWRDTGPMTGTAVTPAGTFDIVARRYEKST